MLDELMRLAPCQPWNNPRVLRARRAALRAEVARAARQYMALLDCPGLEPDEFVGARDTLRRAVRRAEEAPDAR